MQYSMKARPFNDLETNVIRFLSLNMNRLFIMTFDGVEATAVSERDLVFGHQSRQPFDGCHKPKDEICYTRRKQDFEVSHNPTTPLIRLS